MKIPENLKDNALNQIDQVLFILGDKNRISLTASSFMGIPQGQTL